MKLKNPIPQRIHSLDGFRGIFALLVVLYHANNNTFLTNNFLIRQSSLFVDYFFVLSGFVISYSYAHRIFNFKSFGDFIKKRIIRLYPLLLYTTLAYVSFILIGKYFNLVNAQNNILLETVDTLTFMNSTPIFGSSIGMNYPSWSISSEMISYTLWGLSLFLFIKKPFLAFTISSLLFLTFMVISHYHTFALDFTFVRGAFCFYLGYFVFLISKEQTDKKLGTVVELGYLLLLLFVFKYTGENKGGLANLIYPFLFSLGIFLFIKSSGIVNQLLNSGPIQFLGKISYSIYLNHALVLIFVEKALFSVLKLSKTSLYVNITYLLVSLICILVYSYFTHKYIEIGLGEKMKRIFSAKSNLSNSDFLQMEHANSFRPISESV